MGVATDTAVASPPTGVSDHPFQSSRLARSNVHSKVEAQSPKAFSFQTARRYQQNTSRRNLNTTPCHSVNGLIAARLLRAAPASCSMPPGAEWQRQQQRRATSCSSFTLCWTPRNCCRSSQEPRNLGIKQQPRKPRLRLNKPLDLLTKGSASASTKERRRSSK